MVVVPAEIGLQATDAEGKEIIVRLVVRAPVAQDHCWKSWAPSNVILRLTRRRCPSPLAG